MLQDEPGSTTSQQRTTLSYTEQHLILQPWLRRVTYHPFANLAGMSGVSIVKKWLHFPTIVDRIPSTTPGAEPPRDAKDSGSGRSHSTHLETSSSDRP